MSEQAAATETTAPEFDVDATLDAIENSSPKEIPMSEASTQTQQAPAPGEFEFEHKGKLIKAPYSDPRLKQWAQKGYDYAQRMAEYNLQRQAWEKQKTEFDDKYKTYQEIDTWAVQNPDQWQALQDLWKNRDTTSRTQDPNNPILQELNPLRQELSTIKQWIQEKQQHEQKTTQAQEDKALQEEIQSIRNKWKDLDWDTPDQENKTLEYKVIEYANQRGIKNFTDAFQAFYFPQALKRFEERGKESAAKERQRQTKLGLLGTSPTPKTGLTNAENVGSKSHEDLLKEALEELGIA